MTERTNEQNLNPHQLVEKIHAWREGMLEAGEIQDLYQQLVQSPELCEALLDGLLTEADLCWSLSPQKQIACLSSTSSVTNTTHSLSSGESSPVNLYSTRSTVNAGRKKVIPQWMMVTIPLVMVACFANWFLMSSSNRRGEVVQDWSLGTFVITDARTEVKNEFQPGKALTAGSFEIGKGEFDLTSVNGVMLHLIGPAQINLHSNMEITLSSGTVGAYIPPAGHGFTIHTPPGSITDKGTEFWVKSSRQGADIQVREGKVEVSGPGTGNQPITMYAAADKSSLLTGNSLKEEGSVPVEFNHRFVDPQNPTTSGNMIFMQNRRDSLEPGKTEDNKLIRVYPEGGARRLSNPLPVDILEPGQYDSLLKWKQADKGGHTLAAGTRIQSYFVHYDPVGKVTKNHSSGSITFPGRILGVIAHHQTLQKTHPILITPELHPSGQSSAKGLHGVDPVIEELDRLILSEDRHTLTLILYAGEFMDQLRILVESPYTPASP